jgi:capping protein (actin filament) muscle Z-line, alpha
VYKYNPHTSILKGTINITVHYYEDGNVLLTTDHPVEKSGISGPSAVVKAIAEDEKAYQEELNRTFTGLGDGVFKGLRRLLPVTKQKIEWDRVASYKVKPGPTKVG